MSSAYGSRERESAANEDIQPRAKFKETKADVSDCQYSKDPIKGEMNEHGSSSWSPVTKREKVARGNTDARKERRTAGGQEE